MPEYRFFDQFTSIYLRKLLSVIRSPQAIIMTILPLIFIVLAVIIAKETAEAAEDETTMIV